MIFTFKDFTQKLITELAIYDLDLSNFDNYFSDINDSIKTLKNFDFEIKKLIELFKQLDKNKIYISGGKYKDGENFTVNFELKIKASIDAIESFYNEIRENNEEVLNKIDNEYFGGGELNFLFDVEIEKENFNKFHFPINLPSFLKNIGLGKKIILKSIDKFGYCMFSKEEDSIDLKIAINSIVKNEKEYYSFFKDSNILIFNDNFDLISKNIKEWYKNDYDEFVLDKDFYDKYKNDIIKDDFLNNIYISFKEKYN